MNEKDIYDIMDKVNETNEYNNDNLLSDLPQRTPLVSKIRSVVYKSADPVQSVSSSEPVTESGTKLTSMKNMIVGNKNMQETGKKITKHVQIQEPLVESISEPQSFLVTDVTIQQNNLTSFLGYNIPWATIYFLLVIIVIAVALYLLTGEKKKDIDKDKDKEKDKEKEKEKEKENEKDMEKEKER